MLSSLTQACLEVLISPVRLLQRGNPRPPSRPRPSRAVIGLVALLGFSSAAAAAPDLLLSSGMAQRGGRVLLPLGFVGDSDIVALQLDVVHDSAVLGVDGVTAGPALIGGDHELSWNLVAPGRLRILVLSRTNAGLPGGAVATLALQVAGDAPLGDQALQVEGAELVTNVATVVAPDLLSGGSVSVVGCLPGDVHPVGVGDASLTLADYVQALRDLGAGTAVGGRYAACGDLAAGAVTCANAAPEAWCPAADGGSFSQADALVLRRLASGVARLSCADCDSLPAPQAPLVPGDIAPTQGVVDVSDVLRILRVAVGLDTLDAAGRLAADVAPADPAVEGVRSVRGDGVIDVLDVLIVLRLAVGLEQLDWPLRTLVLSLPNSASFVAFSASVSGVPSSAGTPTLRDADCADSAASGTDASIGSWALTCVSDPALRSGVTGAVASFGYRAPEAIDASSLVLTSELVDATLATTAGALSLAAGAP